MRYSVGDKVRVTSTPARMVTAGEEGVVREVVHGLGYFVTIPKNAHPNGLTGSGWTLTDSELEPIEAA